MKIWIKMLAGLGVGIAVGAYIGPESIFMEPLRVVGRLFFKLLSFMVLPLLLFSAVRSALYLRQNRRLFLVLVKALGYFLVLSAAGAAIGVVLGDVLEPGAGTNIKQIESPAVIQYPGTSRFFLSIVPQSILEFLKSGYAVLGVLFTAFLLAAAIILAKQEAREFHSLVNSIDNTLHRLNLIILEFLPIGVLAYIGYIMGDMTVDTLMPYLRLVLVIIAGVFIQVCIVQALLVYFLTGVNPFKFIHAVLAAGLLGYTFGSRYTAYPVLAENMEHNLGADREVFTFAAGLGTTFSLSGSALASGITTMFVAQVYGLDLSVYLQVIIVLLITAVTLKMDGLRQGSVVILSVVLSHIVRLPAEGYALVLGVAGLICQIETVANVVGNAAVSYIMSHSEKSVTAKSIRDFL